MDKRRTLGLGLVLALSTSTAFANPNPPPEGYSQVITLIADGTFDPSVPHPTVPGCVNGVCDGNYYYEEVIRISEEEAAKRTEEAKEFFLNRFGLDADELVEAGRAAFVNAYFDPRRRYRPIFISGKRVRKDDWVNHDQVYMLISTDPAGLEMGGEFEEARLFPGELIAFGAYKMRRERKRANGTVRILDELPEIRYQSSAPIQGPSLDNTSTFRCEIPQSAWGSGQANGLGGQTVNPDGTITIMTRNTITLEWP